MKNVTSSLIFLFIFTLINPVFGQSTATYNIEFESIWESVTDNATTGQSTIALPGSAHWSGLVITTHKTVNTFLMMGAAASPGIESVAETGSTSIFQTEVNNNADANQFKNAGGLSSAKGTITENGLQVSEEFPLVSLASMIAPSPDWFIGINGLTLRSGNNGVNNGWKDTFTVDVFPYDAGTEDGDGYSGANNDTNGVITSRSNTTPFNDKKIGTITFTYINSTLSIDKLNPLENISVYPNPTSDKINISNLQNIDLKSFEVYNILGKLVKTISIEKNILNLEVNTSNFRKGIYILKLNTHKNISKTQKLIIN